jgi:subtilisin family serine protease
MSPSSLKISLRSACAFFVLALVAQPALGADLVDKQSEDGDGPVLSQNLLASWAARDLAGSTFQQTSANPNASSWSLVGLPVAATGAGVKVAVLDGLTDCAHPDLVGRCTAVKLTGGRYRRADSHGTHTAGIVAGKNYGIAPGATVINYAVFDDRGWVASGTKLSNAWKAAYTAGARISSMSFGCTNMALCFSDTELTTMGTANLPMLYVKAAGNDGVAVVTETTAISSGVAQAALNRILLVGSVDNNGTISYFSNTPGSACLLAGGASSCSQSMMFAYHFLVAPGESIYSTLPRSSYGAMSGTSMATPVVAGAAALLQERWPALKNTPETLAAILLTTATDLGDPGVDGVYGYGLLNVTAAFQANGTVQMVSPTGIRTSLNGSSVLTSPGMTRLGNALAGVTVYDRFGRDFTLAETGAVAFRPNALAARQFLGRRLMALSGRNGGANAFFADMPQARAFAMFGSPAEMPGSELAMDRSTRMGVDMPFKGGIAQIRLTGASNPRSDFAFDPTMQPLAFFPSTDLYTGALISNATLRLSANSRLMVYGLTTPGAMMPSMPYNPLEMTWGSAGFMPRIALDKSRAQRRQTGFGLGYWVKPDASTMFGLNVSAVTQKGGYYALESDIPDFQRPTQVFNLGAAASKQTGNWQVRLSGEATHLRTSATQGGFGFTPATLASAELSLQKDNVLFGDRGGRSDSLSVAIVMPPRAVSGALKLDYLTQTSDGMGQHVANLRVPLAGLVREPERFEMAYRLTSGPFWSFDLSGGINLRRADGFAAGEGMATLKLAL